MEILQKMDWIHCNNCYKQPGDCEALRFSITNCGHIFCSQCADPKESRECLSCHAPCCNAIIGPKMIGELENYFTEPLQIFQRMINTMQFQMKHRNRLQSFKKKQLNSLENEILSIKKKFEQMEKKMASIHEGVKRMGSQMLEFQEQIANLRQKSSSLENSPIPKGSHSNNSVSKKLTPQARMEASENKRIILKRPPEGAKFFATSTPIAPQCDNDTFITPPSKRSGSYRSSNVFDSNSSSSDKFSPQRDPFFRKFKLPGDKGGPPRSVTALHRLNLSKQTSKARINKMGNTRYSEYFK